MKLKFDEKLCARCLSYDYLIKCQYQINRTITSNLRLSKLMTFQSQLNFNGFSFPLKKGLNLLVHGLHVCFNVSNI